LSGGTGIFGEINYSAYWWTKSGAMGTNRQTTGSTIVEYFGNDKKAGFAVRCIKD